MAEGGRRVVNVRVGGPNAGHSVVGRCPKECGQDDSGHHVWRLRQVPVAAVTNERASLVIAAGSEIDPGVLDREIEELDSAGYDASGRLLVDQSATVLTSDHVAEEENNDIQQRLGSTAKGIGSARADRIWRTAERVGDRDDIFAHVEVLDTAHQLEVFLRNDAAVVVEGTQGYALGLHTENYPFVTSGDCRAIDFLAQAGISPWQTSGPYTDVDLKVVVCLRPYPIRVAGNSGQLKGETSWDELGLPVEHTTVTQKIRRVGEWDAELAQAALRANGGPRAGVVYVALTMLDSVEPAVAGQNHAVHGWRPASMPKSASELLHSLGLDTWDHLGYAGTGPDTAIVNREMYS